MTPKVVLSLLPTLLCALPNLSCPSMGPMVACSCYQPLYTRFQLLKCSLVEPIFCTIDVKLRPNLNFSRFTARLEMCSKFQCCIFSAGPYLNVCPNFTSLFLVELVWPMIVCFYYQHLYIHFQLPIVLQLNQW